MTLPMDVRLLAEGARDPVRVRRRGIVPEAARSWFLPRIVGPSRAFERCLTARMFSAEVAFAAGLARIVYPPRELLSEARVWPSTWRPRRARSRWPSPARCRGGCSPPPTRWRPTGSDSLAISRTGALADATKLRLTAFLEKTAGPAGP